MYMYTCIHTLEFRVHICMYTYTCIHTCVFCVCVYVYVCIIHQLDYTPSRVEENKSQYFMFL